MTYQTIYSSTATVPMLADDLEALLRTARNRNDAEGISGALIYTDGTFMQILEGERAKVEALMARIVKDRRHERVTILREGEIPAARFGSWKMAYVSATPEQVANWTGPRVKATANGSEEAGDELHRTARLVRDVLALLSAEAGPTGSTAPVTK